MVTIYCFIAKEIADRLEHESTAAKLLRCSQVGIFFGDFYEDFACSIKQHILGTTWTDFFEDVWERHKGYSPVYPEGIGNDMHTFVSKLRAAAENHADDLIPYIYAALSGRFFCCECTVVDSREGKLLIMASVG